MKSLYFCLFLTIVSKAAIGSIITDIESNTLPVPYADKFKVVKMKKAHPMRTSYDELASGPPAEQMKEMRAAEPKSDRKRPIVESHTYQHDWFRNLFMFVFIGISLTWCTLAGLFYSFFFDIQGWYWDCLDNARTNLTLI